VTGNERRHVLISGASGGIGVALVDAFKAGGHHVTGFDLSDSEASSSCDRFVKGDIRDPEACLAAVEAASDARGRLHVLVNSAGINSWQPFVEMDLELARSIFEVNVWGTVCLTRSAASALIAAPAAAVVTITSINGELGMRSGAAYGMSKSALTALTKTLAVEWAEHDVRVNAVAPAIVPTAMNAAMRVDEEFIAWKLSGIPMRRMVEPSEVASAVVFLAGSGASSITGEVLHTDGGAAIAG
jgi:NAD(P)-dependent dehydrogenase (short-subunit alcohol dehydrogenase family)